MWFTKRAKQRISDDALRVEARSNDVTALRLSHPMPLPVLAKADADVAQFAVGTFSLYKMKPDALADSGQDRDAYALGEIRSGDDVRLNWHGGEASQGFWGAEALPAKRCECSCDLIDAMLDAGVITETEHTALSETLECGDQDTVDCANWAGGVAPATFEAVTLDAVPTAGDLGDWAVMSTWLKANPQTLTETEGFPCNWDSPWTTVPDTSIGGGSNWDIRYAASTNAGEMSGVFLRFQHSFLNDFEHVAINQTLDMTNATQHDLVSAGATGFENPVSVQMQAQ